MSDNAKPFVSVGIPHDSSPDDTVDQRVGLHLLDTLDALASVYESAAYFAGAVGDDSIADYTLTRCLQSVDSECGAIYLDDGRRLELHSERQGAAALLDQGALAGLGRLPRVVFHNAPGSAAYVVPAAGGRNVLLAPIATVERRLGLVVILTEPGIVFHTVHAKLVSAVTSQAAIALSRVMHYRDVEIERSKLRAVIEQHPHGIVVLRADGATLLCNTFARQLCGLPDGTAHDFDVAAELARLGNISLPDLLGGKAAGEIMLGAGTEQRVIGFQSNDIRDPEGELVNVIVTLHDLTEQRREERLKRDFLSLISHKFRTPITAILGALMLLEEPGTEQRAELVEEARRRANDLGTLVDRLLYFTEIIEGSWSTRGRTDLLELRTEIDAQLGKRLGYTGSVTEWQVAANARHVAMPSARLRVVLDNLIENAVKFGPRDKPWVRVTSRRCGDGWLSIDVEDRGPGIAAHERTRIFHSFYQHDEYFTGTVPGVGIGLAMASRIVSRMGGRIEFRDAKPWGSVFRLTLPAEPEPATKA